MAESEWISVAALSSDHDHEHEWDLWWLEVSNYTLLLGRAERYEIDLERVWG